MDVEHVKLEEADLKDLRWFATVAMQLELRGNENGNQLKAKIREVWPKEEIFTGRKDPGYPPHTDKDGNGRGPVFEAEFPAGSGKMRKCCKIRIEMMDPKVYPGGREPVPVSVNGIAMYIPRGASQIVPVEYVEALENAEKFVYAEYDPEEDGGIGGLKAPQIVKEYPFSHVA